MRATAWLELLKREECNLLMYLAPRAGFEPATNRLTAGCSTTELPGNTAPRCAASAYNKAGPAMKASSALPLQPLTRCASEGWPAN